MIPTNNTMNVSRETLQNKLQGIKKTPQAPRTSIKGYFILAAERIHAKCFT